MPSSQKAQSADSVTGGGFGAAVVVGIIVGGTVVGGTVMVGVEGVVGTKLVGRNGAKTKPSYDQYEE